MCRTPPINFPHALTGEQEDGEAPRARQRSRGFVGGSLRLNHRQADLRHLAGNEIEYFAFEFVKLRKGRARG